MTNRFMKEKEHLQNKLIEQLDYNKQLKDEEIEDIIEEEVLQRGREVYLSVEEKQQLKKELFNSFRRLDVLSGLLEVSTFLLRKKEGFTKLRRCLVMRKGCEM